ncbi:Hypothetical protein SRAE_2000231600 [Strongyloides ratti]|uniref:Transmembrane protein 242 n=1 Tax=Strongyloides ratti TaxID=34506 RepID=A0A090LJD7_STRRB|nr:Hypothetical protein SRAE_2000231600 [Strongyloides ratti]CEF67655.1 Hypothetical protein SRAE_2000231600 [Strongyloides ratti]
MTSNDSNDKRTLSLIQNLENQCSDFKISPNLIKALAGFTAAITFGFGIKSARTAFASKALATATILTVSGFSLFLLGVSFALDVNTPKQFGTRMKNLFGDSLKISKSNPDSKVYNSLTELFEEVSSKPNTDSKNCDNLKEIIEEVSSKKDS